MINYVPADRLYVQADQSMTTSKSSVKGLEERGALDVPLEVGALDVPFLVLVEETEAAIRLAFIEVPVLHD